MKRTMSATALAVTLVSAALYKAGPAPDVRTPAGSNNGWTVTVPVNVSAGPAAAGRESCGETTTPDSADAGPALYRPADTRVTASAVADMVRFITE